MRETRTNNYVALVVIVIYDITCGYSKYIISIQIHSIISLLTFKRENLGT